MDVVSLLSQEEMLQRLALHGRAVRPSVPYTLHFPQRLVERATHRLQENGVHGLEQLVLWSGYSTAHGVIISDLLLPATEANWGWVHVLPPEQLHIVNWLQTHGQLLFAEMHTHGTGPRATEMSDEDRRHPAGRQDGFLTIIVPGYARGGIDFLRAGIWECCNLTWMKWHQQDIHIRLRVVEDGEARYGLGIDK